MRPQTCFAYSSSIQGSNSPHQSVERDDGDVGERGLEGRGAWVNVVWLGVEIEPREMKVSLSLYAEGREGRALPDTGYAPLSMVIPAGLPLASWREGDAEGWWGGRGWIVWLRWGAADASLFVFGADGQLSVEGMAKSRSWKPIDRGIVECGGAKACTPKEP